MKINLKKLVLHNFKGIRDLEINFKEDITNIFGDNGTGKTTIFDAYLWLLFDKDSSNSSNFNIKTLDEDGKPLHQLDHFVEGIFDIDGKEISFKKVYKEKWTKKRGATEAVFDGHTCDYFINAVPVKLKDYKDRIASLIDEEKFKLISNPRYFSVDLDKAKRREILMSISDIKDEDLLDDEFKDLDLGTYSIGDLSKMAKASAKLCNDRLKELPVRIDELNKSIVDLDFDVLDFQRSSKIGSIKKIDEDLASGDTSGAVQSINKDLADLVSQRAKLTFEVDERNRKTRAEVEDYNSQEELRFLKEIRLENEKKEKRAYLKERLKTYEEALNTNRQKWKDIQGLEENIDDRCPTCGQQLPEDQIANAREKFNLSKAEKLEKLIADSEEIKKTIEKINLDLKDLEARPIQSLVKREFIPEAYPEEIKNIDLEIENLKNKLQAEKPRDKADLIAKKKDLQAELDDLNKKLAYKETNEKTRAKIEEYRGQMKESSKEYDQAQYILDLIDKFNRKKADLISKDISDKFKLVKWKLFEEQINGGIAEVCEATVNGVPYADVNNANKINAGIDIINTLANHFDLEAPIFVDNAESVNDLIGTDSQVIRLVVSKDRKLKVE